MVSVLHTWSVILFLSVAVTGCPWTAAASEPMAILPVAPRAGSGDISLGQAPAKKTALLGLGPRYGIGGNSPLGEEQKENFQLYDIAALFRLPWGHSLSSGWALETRLMTSAGELTAAGTSSLMATLVPCLAVVTRDGRFSLDVGLGGGFFSNHRFGVQDFGGPAQIIGTTGVGVKLLADFHAGYRFQHFSDAGMYGPTSLGVDMHIMEVRYRF